MLSLGKRRCKIQTNFLATLFFYLNTIECVLLLDRIASVCQIPRLKSLLKINPWCISLVLFAFCNLVQAPSYFYFSARTSQEYAQAQADAYQYSSNFTYCFQEPFFTSIAGRILTILSILTRDILMIFVEVFLAFYSIFAFKRYLNNLRAFNSAHIFNRLEIFNIGLSKMSILLSLMSVMAHIFAGLAVSIGAFDRSGFIGRIFTFTAAFFASIKFISNFFLFYYFNQSFHDSFRPNYENREIRLTHLGL